MAWPTANEIATATRVEVMQLAAGEYVTVDYRYNVTTMIAEVVADLASKCLTKDGELVFRRYGRGSVPRAKVRFVNQQHRRLRQFLEHFVGNTGLTRQGQQSFGVYVGDGARLFKAFGHYYSQ